MSRARITRIAKLPVGARRKRHLKRLYYDVKTVNRPMFYGSSDVEDLKDAETIQWCLENGASLEKRRVKVLATNAEWTRWMKDHIKGQIIYYTQTSGRLYQSGIESVGWYCNSDSIIYVNLSGSPEFVNRMDEKISASFQVAKAYVEWIYSSEGDSITVQLDSSRLPHDKMYPHIKGGINDYYDRYLASSSSILILIGAPGTGKSTFIKGLIARSERPASVSYDEAILTRDSFFANFISGDCNLMVLEDSDNFLSARSNGNNMMHRFLNVGDGLVSTGSKKLIFSTNLPNVKDIDPALIRPGRCFDVLEFGKLTAAQANELCKVEGIKGGYKDGMYSLAEIMNPSQSTNEPSKIHSVGFY